MEYIRKAYYHETDQMGVIHHSNYLKWLEEARIDFLDKANISYRKLEEMGVISPVVSISIEYKSPVLFDDTVVIKTNIINVSSAKFEFEYDIYRISDNKLCVHAVSKHCFLKDNRIISIKKEYPEIHQRLLDMLGVENDKHSA